MAKTKLLSLLLGVGLVSLFTYTFHTHFQLPNVPNDLTLQDWPISPCFTICSHNTMFVGLLFYTPEYKHTEGRKLRFQAAKWPKQNWGGLLGWRLLVPLFTHTFHTQFQLPSVANDLTPQDWPISPYFTICSHNTRFVGLLF